MTVTEEPGRQSFTGDGVEVDFDFSFKIFTDTDIEVYIDGVLAAVDVDYTVEISTSTIGFTLHFLVAPPAPAIPLEPNGLVIRVVPYSQDTQLPLTGKLPIGPLQNALDKNTILIQQVNELVARSIQKAITDTSEDPIYLPEPDDGHALVWDGTGIANSTYDLETLLDDGSANAAAAAASAIAAANDAVTSAASALDAANAALAAIAAAGSINLPNIAGQALNYLRVNSGATGYEHRTPSQVLQSLAAALATTKGDIFVWNGTSLVRFGVGADGTIVMADSAQAAGVKYIAPVFTVTSISPNFAVAAGVTRSFAHGLGARPKMITIELECTTADAGYAVNDVVYTNMDGSNAKGIHINADSTNVNGVLSTDAAPISIVTKGTRVATTITNASWVFRMRAYL